VFLRTCDTRQDGCGVRAALDGRYDQDIMVEDLKCVIAACNDRRPALVGASMGGGTSLVAVGEDHVNANALVMVDVAPRIEQGGVAKIRAFMRQQPSPTINRSAGAQETWMDWARMSGLERMVSIDGIGIRSSGGPLNTI
jgi:pimeloyl-ACP methyl ester carboxylesterase